MRFPVSFFQIINQLRCWDFHFFFYGKALDLKDRKY